MLDILIVSNEDTCRSRMAQELLLSFGRGMTIFTAGAMAGSGIDSLVSQMMSEQGHELSRKKPMAVDLYRGQQWDVVITLCDEAKEAVATLDLKSKHLQHFLFADPFDKRGRDEEMQKSILLELYQTMHRELFRYYRNILSDLLMPSCTCGANTYCRCE